MNKFIAMLSLWMVLTGSSVLTAGIVYLDDSRPLPAAKQTLAICFTPTHHETDTACDTLTASKSLLTDTSLHNITATSGVYLPDTLSLDLPLANDKAVNFTTLMRFIMNIGSSVLEDTLSYERASLSRHHL
jgi:hypothetical protein